MRLPPALRQLDDRLLGNRFRRRDPVGPDASSDRETVVIERSGLRDRPTPPNTGQGAAQVLAVTVRISRAVLLVLAVAVGLGIVFTLAPTNADNVIVRNTFELARSAAGPFRDVFSVGDNPDRELIVNYAFAAVVYAALAAVVGKIGRKS